MSRPTDKDFDALVRRGLATGIAELGGEHASAEILAAWSESALDPGEQRRWEEHFSRCDRCQEELVAFAQTQGAAPTQLPWWRQLALPSFPVARWAVAGATAVLALSVAIRLAPEAERRVAGELAVRSAPSSAPAGERRAAERNGDRFLERYERPAPEPESSFAKRRSELEPLRDAEPGSGPEGSQAKWLAMEREARDAGDAQQKEADAPSPEARTEAERAQRFARTEPPAAAPPPAAAVPPRDRAAPERQDADEAPARRGGGATQGLSGTPERPAAEERAGTEASGPLGALQSREGSPARHILVASPDRTHLWRIGDGGTIEHFSPGAGWRPQASGVDADLLGGMSPMERVCWVVGREGTILRTGDGETWRRVSSPTDADLAHVFAVDADHATVTTTSGDAYRTEDGGLHWRALPKPAPTP